VNNWLEVQEWLYTEGLKHAKLNAGVLALIRRLKELESPIFIVSHKTSYSQNKRLNLIDPANNWLQTNLENLLEENQINVYFEESRRDKIQRISKLELTHFVDDLKEVFEEEMFPREVQKFLLSKQEDICEHKAWIRVGSITEILAYV
jgi:hypothetical protein